MNATSFAESAGRRPDKRRFRARCTYSTWFPSDLRFFDASRRLVQLDMGLFAGIRHSRKARERVGTFLFGGLSDLRARSVLSTSAALVGV